MKVSIIVPVYNVENYINKCIDSLINQNYQKIETILVNNGSTDNSGKICDDYEKKENVDNLEAINQNENRHLRLLSKNYTKNYYIDNFNVIKANLIYDIKQIDLSNNFISNKILFYVFSFNRNIFSYLLNIFIKEHNYEEKN